MPESAAEGAHHSDVEFQEALDDIDEVDFADIELPDAAHFTPAQWQDDRYNVLRGARGTVYEGRTRGNCKAGPGKLWDAERAQYIDGEWEDDRLVVLHFAQFQINDTDFFRLNGLDDLITSNKHHFVARITKQPLDISSDHFPDLRRHIESKITITKILDDDLKNDLHSCREKFKSTLKSRQQELTRSRRAQRDMFHLFLLKNEMINDYDFEDDWYNITVLCKIANNVLFSQELRNEAEDACKIEQQAYTRSQSLPIMKLSGIKFSWKSVINECIEDSIKSMKIALQQSLPNRAFIHSGPEDIDKLQTHQLFTCSVYDIQLFSDLEFTMRQHSNFYDFTQKYISQLWRVLITKISNSVLPDIPDKSVFTNSVFLQLIKTFLELLNILSRNSQVSVEQLVSVTSNSDLEMAKCSKRCPTSYDKRLQFVINLMNHFKPGDIKNYLFKYEFSFFKVDQNWLRRMAGYISGYFDNSLTNIAQEYIIWLYYVHKSFCQLFPEEHEPHENVNETNENVNETNENVNETNENVNETNENVNVTNENINKINTFLNSLLNLFKVVVTKNEVSLEKIRILANSVIKFGTTISPYFLEQSSMNAEDMSLLLKQAEYMKDFVTANEHALDDITNIVDIYQVFWDERKNLFAEIHRIYSDGLPKTKVLTSIFTEFVIHVFNMKIFNNKFLIFLRSFNEFVRLFRATNFPWYVREDDLVSCDFVELKDSTNNSFLVNNSASFLQEFANNSRTPPRHYLLDASIYFLQCTLDFLNKNTWNVNDKMQASSDLLLLMGRSLIKFKKLPNSVDFDNFFAMFTEPFSRVTTKAIDINDFKSRLGSLEKYTIELNVISVSKALELCRENMSSCHSAINYSFDSSILETCYNVYWEKFNSYVDEYILQKNFKIKKLAAQVNSEVKSKDISKWNSEYKTTKLPELLAGLSAVWSALESKDVICQKQVIKPHCIQILCILRLLGVDQKEVGFDSHLAQVLTGQGKSIVLSLLAAVLALTGNRVRIVCYNEYLAKRDENDFQSFYKTFKIQDKITYGTLDDLADEILSPEIKGTSYNLRKFVRELMTGDLPRLFLKEEENLVNKTVLLIDEVDVFFSPEFYGNTYSAGTMIGSEAVADLQIKIWKLTENTTNKDDLRENIEKYIDEEFPKSTDSTFVNIVRNCRTVLNSHVDIMISEAINVRNNSERDSFYRRYKIRNDGLLITIKNDGKHSTTTYYSYNNVFMYFKLQRTKYDHKCFHNYGYLNVHCGRISYAMLPKDYRAILGVTGTLKQLSDVEMSAVTSYNISRGSDMPTFFGSCKLRVTNFTIKDSVDEWTTAILDSVLSHVAEERAVLVFFEDEQTIDSLRAKFASHLSRYSVLTGNESAEELATCVEEAGVACKVTIATRRMGRGVDYKSNDSAVENKGGVHVIQTFWSEDVKEETQIKGRTARKDNNGSYESILCREHLSEAGYASFLCSYNMLCTTRESRARAKGTELEEAIDKSQQNHEATMDFLRSFYNYSPGSRADYFLRYPFIEFTSS